MTQSGHAGRAEAEGCSGSSLSQVVEAREACHECGFAESFALSVPERIAVRPLLSFNRWFTNFRSRQLTACPVAHIGSHYPVLQQSTKEETMKRAILTSVVVIFST